MNIASTGAGKTRMNARAAAVLSGDTPLRFTTVLNLRSLTLQTGDAYKKNVGMQPDELSVVIGNTATLKMHAYEADDIAQSDIDAVEECDGELVYGKDQDFELPEWIRSLTNRNPSAASVMMSPVLVSTIDYIINAADPRRQASHAIALVRLMHSHLIIDEMDGYTPKQLAAVLRLIKIAAMFGKHVIISSGTLPAVIAEYAWKSYRAGFEIHQSMNGISTPFTCVVMDDSVTPLHISSDTTSSFVDLYNDHVKTMMLAVAEKPVTKKGEIITIKGRCTRRDVGDAIVATAQTMHERHAWFAHKKDGTAVRISFGLTRIANIKNAIGVASRLAKENHTDVSCYHARHFVIQRYHIENRLDHMLNRKNGSGHITEAEEIRALIEKATPDDNGICQVRIVVVATPVEEIGRDHDFDWAIIEPSSVHSIVQTAGRVNRHRLDPITEANIAILQFNFNHIDLMHHTNRKGGAAHQSCFTQPGLEAIDHNGSTHPDHDVYNLIDQNLIAERLDASLGFDVGAHKFAQYDNDAMTSHLKKLAEPMIEGTQEWMSSNLYEETLLRERAPSDEWFLDENLAWQKKEWVSTNGLVQQKFTEHSDKWKLVDVTGENFHNALFTLSLQEMSDLAVKMDIPRETAFKVRINNGGKKYEMSPFGCKILDSQ
jgi:CRISPR-associated endonuclease/helicase Cas3